MKKLNVTAAKAAEICSGELVGNPDFFIEGFAALEETNDKSVSFVNDVDKLRKIKNFNPGCLIAPLAAKGVPISFGGPVIYAKNPHWALTLLLRYAENRDLKTVSGIHPSAVIAPSAKVGENVYIAPNVVIEEGAVIGDYTALYPGVYIGRNSTVGHHTVIHPNVVIEHECTIGNHVIIFANSVIGSDGYGYIPVNNVHEKIPQIATVVIEDYVEIGAGTCIDRGALTDTFIGAGTKIDNQVQIAHNVKIGKACLVIGQSGIAGSTKIGNGVIVAGKAGIRDHVTIGDGARIAMLSGVMSDIKPGEAVFGTPARDYKETMKIQAIVSRLPEIYSVFRRLKRDLKNEENKH